MTPRLYRPLTTLMLATALTATLATVGAGESSAAGPSAPGRDVYETTQPPVDDTQREVFSLGRVLFNHAWSPGPPSGEAGRGVGRAQAGGRILVQSGFPADSGFNGLGPTYNRLSCTACHIKNGRGEPPAVDNDPLRAMLVRLSVPGTDDHGGPHPHPAYGDQLNDHAVPGVPAEGRAYFSWTERRDTLADGTVITLRRPSLRFSRLAFGPLGDDTMASARVGPAVFGLGLLEAVPEPAILALADVQTKAGQGVAGKPNRVWDIAKGETVLGRFGLKANTPTVRQQIAGAFRGDLGITSSLYPAPNCPTPQAACANAPEGPQPELSGAFLDAIETYVLALLPPPRRNTADPAVLRGEAIFAQAGCTACHVPVLETAPHPRLAGLGGALIQPYTDLLLHDMGPDLADNRPDYQANGRQWRTTPLWGLGLVAQVADTPSFLHDGRARTPLEAVLWHGGEAAAGAAAVRSLSTPDREALMAFLASL